MPLHVAAELGLKEVVLLLLNSNANIDTGDEVVRVIELGAVVAFICLVQPPHQ
jgi:hypothetical protein